MPFLYFDPTWIILIPAIILALYAQAKINSTYNRYSKIPSNAGYEWAASCQCRTSSRESDRPL